MCKKWGEEEILLLRLYRNHHDNSGNSKGIEILLCYINNKSIFIEYLFLQRIVLVLHWNTKANRKWPLSPKNI